MASEIQPPTILVSIYPSGVAVLQLNRPRKRNALSQDMIDEVARGLNQLQCEQNVRAVVITSVEESPFCAGADLNELSRLSTVEAHRRMWLKDLETAISSMRKPVIAAVRGFAYGGGFEIALMCDMVFASFDARFGFPEITLGTMPGAGGTQRLTKTLGKHKAMELVLTGTPVPATELERFGLINKVCQAGEDVVQAAVAVAERVASLSAPAVQLAKQAVKTAEATSLDAGLELERALYYSSFSLADCREGVEAFLQKRSAVFQHR